MASASRVSMHCDSVRGTEYDEPRPEATCSSIALSDTLSFSPSLPEKARLPSASTDATMRNMSATCCVS